MSFHSKYSHLYIPPTHPITHSLTHSHKLTLKTLTHAHCQSLEFVYNNSNKNVARHASHLLFVFIFIHKNHCYTVFFSSFIYFGVFFFCFQQSIDRPFIVVRSLAVLIFFLYLFHFLCFSFYPCHLLHLHLYFSLFLCQIACLYICLLSLLSISFVTHSVQIS